jgi:Polyketide cyclase / dehydrase and lipid transport
VEVVWAAIRDFGALASWHPGIEKSEIERGDDPDVVGCIRQLTLKDWSIARERLMMLDDSRYRFAYNFETPAFPVANYLSTVELVPVTNGDSTFASWSATFDERPEDAGSMSTSLRAGRRSRHA